MTPERIKEVVEGAYRTLDLLEKEIAKVDQEISGKVPFHIKPKWKRCGKEGCVCNRGRLHGPYLYGYIPDEEVRTKRREKKGRGSTRKEVYIGKSFEPPEGWVRPRELKELLHRRHQLMERREGILKRLSRIEEEVLKLAYGR